MREHTNNFDLLRLVLASTVLLVHSYELSANDSLKWIPIFFSSKVAIDSFFVISGFLIFQSYEKSKTLSDYFSKRARRIYPAYFFVVVSCALLGFMLSDLSVRDYFSHPKFFKYLLANLVFLNFLQPDLPGVFVGNQVKGINGALWTIMIEVIFYAVVPLLGTLVARFKPTIVFVTAFILSVAYHAFFMRLAQDSGNQLYYKLALAFPGQLMYFCVGGWLYYHSAIVKSRAWMFLLIACGGLLLWKYTGVDLFYQIGVGVFVIYMAMGAPFLGNAGRHGDISYGIYIYHFPVLQTFIAFGWFNANPYPALLGVIALVVFISWLSWRYLEKKMLYKTSHYLQVEEKVAMA